MLQVHAICSAHSNRLSRHRLCTASRRVGPHVQPYVKLEAFEITPFFVAHDHARGERRDPERPPFKRGGSWLAVCGTLNSNRKS
jgi:hypothetical protein